MNSTPHGGHVFRGLRSSLSFCAQAFEHVSTLRCGRAAPHSTQKCRCSVRDIPARAHDGEQYIFTPRRIALRSSDFCSARRLPQSHSTSTQAHKRVPGLEVPGGDIASARIDAVIGCAGEYSTACRDDFNDTAAWDASSGFHVTPYSTSGGVIVGAYAGDASGEGLGGGDGSML